MPQPNYTFEDELKAWGFFATLWTVENALIPLRISPIISNVVVGIIMGPSWLDVVPFDDALMFLGKLGVSLLVIESGLGVDLVKLRKVGFRACACAIAAVVLTIVMTIGVMYVAFPGTTLKEALYLGAILAPTSCGFTAKMLQDYKMLDTDNGVLICMAAIVDDVFSLAILGVVIALSGDPSAWDVTRPVLGLVVSGTIGVILTIMLPKLKLLDFVDNKYRGEFGVGLTILLSLAVGWIAQSLDSSDLLGCFVVGVAFGTDQATVDCWEREVKQICGWGTRLFFGATIAFLVPTLEGSFFSYDSLIRYATLFWPALLGKLLVGVFASPLTVRTWNMIGWSMCGRGEFSFLIAAEVLDEDLITQPEFSACMLALLTVSFMAPIGLRMSLPPKPVEDGETPGQTAGGLSEDDVDVSEDGGKDANTATAVNGFIKRCYFTNGTREPVDTTVNDSAHEHEKLASAPRVH